MEPSFCTELEIFEDSTMIGEEEDMLQTGKSARGSSHDYLHPHYGLVQDDISVSSRDEDSHYSGHHRRLSQQQQQTPPLCFRSKMCLMCAYLILTVLLLSSFVSVIVVGIVVASSYHKISKFTRTQCLPSQSSFTNLPVECSCGKGCSSSHVCLRVMVEYVIDNIKNHAALLAENEDALHRQCSYYPQCSKSSEHNDAVVFSYQDNYGRINDTFECFFDPNQPDDVIRESRFQLHHVLHGVTWPIITFIISLSLLCFFARKKGWSFF